MSKVKQLELDLKMQKVDLARDKSQSNVWKANHTQHLKEKEKKLLQLEKELTRREQLLKEEFCKFKRNRSSN